MHEVLWPNDDGYQECALEADSIILHHYQDKEKPRGSYLDLLHLAAEENPQNSHIWSLLGREYILKED